MSEVRSTSVNVVKHQHYFNGLQALRGWAAIAVVFYHCHVLFQKEKYFGVQLFNGFLESGHRGVELFFVISGFLMAMLMQKPREKYSPKAFLVSRVKRIYIPYLPVFILLTCMCVFATSACPAAYRFDAKTVLMNLLVWPREDQNTYVPVVAWSLAHEVFFYLMTFMAIALRSLGWPLLALWFGTSAVLALAEITVVFPWSFIFSFYENMAFGLGMLAFMLVDSGRSVAYTRQIRLTGITLLVIFAFLEGYLVDIRGGTYGRDLAGGFLVAAFLLVVGYADAPPRKMKILGDMSYSLYLVHYPVLVIGIRLLIIPFDGNLPQYFVLVCMLIAAMAAGAMYYYFVERPGLKLFNRKIES